MTQDRASRETDLEMKELLYIMAEATVGLELVGSAGVQSRFSGVHIGKGVILTVHHGISEMQDDAALAVNVKDRKLNGKTFMAQVESVYSGIDMALLTIPSYQFGIQSVSLAENPEIQRGKALIYLPYYPQRRLIGCRVLETQVQPDELSPQARATYPRLTNHLYTIALQNFSPLPGNSGCGVFDSKGQLVGITHAGNIAQAESGSIFPIAYMISTSVVKK